MTISLDSLLKLAGTDAARFQKLGELARRLNALDAERATILAELGEFGVSGDVPLTASERAVLEAGEKALKRPSRDPPCAVCGEPSDLAVDGMRYCKSHDPTGE